MSNISKQIAKQNDLFRQNYGLSIFDKDKPMGRYVISEGIASFDFITLSKIRSQIRTFSNFNENNDPYGEHDLGKFSVNGHDVLWKIDYYDTQYQYGSEDPNDLSKTRRVLTVMLAHEY